MIAVVSVYIGSWIAVKNYYFSLKLNVNSDTFLGSFIKNYIISTQMLFLLAIYTAFAIWSFLAIYSPGEIFVYHVKDYYGMIEFPAFRIHFPFWD